MHWPIQAVLCLPAKQAGREFIVPASQSALLCFSGRLVEVDQQKWCFFISLFNWKGAENRLRNKYGDDARICVMPEGPQTIAYLAAS